MKNINYSYKYLITVSFIMFLSSIAVLYVNYLFDPLWYFKGNRIGNYNVRFDERLSKTNQFLKQSDLYDCFIFGSSRATLLNPNRIKSNTCFNYSFSSGFAVEHLAFSQYVKKWAGPINMVVVSVGGFNFLKPPEEYNIPEFIHELSTPKHWLQNYLSLSALKFSIRVWKGGEFKRQYTKDFVGVEVKRLPHATSDQMWDLIDSISSGKVPINTDDMYSNDQIHVYEKIREVFSNSKLIGYVPPISVDRIALLYVQGKLKGYLKALYSAASIFDEFYDFSNPSVITGDAHNTYDGSHFYPEINNLVVDRMMHYKKFGDFGLDVKKVSFSEYHDIYMKSIAEVLKKRILL